MGSSLGSVASRVVTAVRFSWMVIGEVVVTDGGLLGFSVSTMVTVAVDGLPRVTLSSSVVRARVIEPSSVSSSGPADMVKLPEL